MSKLIVLKKDNEYVHTYSDKKCNDYMQTGWTKICTVYGWNVSISFTQNISKV